MNKLKMKEKQKRNGSTRDMKKRRGGMQYWSSGGDMNTNGNEKDSD